MDQAEINLHLEGMNLAIIREHLGGIPAADSSMWLNAVEALMGAGLSESEITQAYRNKYPK